MAKNPEVKVSYTVVNQAFNQGIGDMNKSIKTLNKEFALQKEQMKNSSSESEKLEATVNSLNQEYELAQQKTKMVASALQNTKEITGENSDATRIWTDKLLDAQKKEEGLKNKIQETNVKLKEAVSAERSLTEEQKKSIEASEKRKAKLSELETSQGKLVSSSEKLTKEYELQVASLGNNARESEKTKLKQQLLADQLKNTASQTQNLEQQLELARQEYGNTSTEVDRLENELLDVRLASQQFTNELEASTNRLANFGSKMTNIGNGMKTVGKNMSMYVTAPIVAGVGLSVKAASDFDSAFTGVKKTVDELVDANGKTVISYDDLEQSIREMAKTIPATTTEISEVAEAAGQLGVKTENVMSFTRTMVDLGVATTMSSEEAATSLAQLANITQMPQTEFNRLGSSIVELGNNFATNESKITAMALRLAGAGSIVGMSEADIVGLATAFSSVGIEAEAGGSAISKVMIEMQLASAKGQDAFKGLQEVAERNGIAWDSVSAAVNNGGKELKEMSNAMGLGNKGLSDLYKTAEDAKVSLEEFGYVAGMTGDDFAKAFQEDAVGALGKFIEGLGNATDKGTTAIEMLDDMGISEVRLRDALLRAGGASDLFASAIESSNNAWNENTALTDEATIRYETFESKLTMVKSKVNDLAIEFGGPLMDALSSALDALEPVFKAITNVAKAFSGASPKMQKFIMIMIATIAAIGPVLTIVGPIMTTIGGIMTAFSVGVSAAAGIVLVIPLIIAAVVALVAAIVLNWDKIKEALVVLKDWFVKTWNSIADSVSEAWNKMVKTVSDFTKNVIDTVVNWLKDMKQKIVDGFNNAVQAAKDGWHKMTDPIVEGAKNIIQSIVDTWESIKQSTIDAWNSFSDFMKPIIDGFVNVIMVPISFIQTMLEAIWLLIVAGVTIAWEAIKIGTQIAWEQIQKYIITPITDAYDFIVTKLTDFGKWIETKWNQIVDLTVLGWNTVKDAIITPIVAGYNTVLQKIGELAAWLVAKWNEIRQGASDLWNKIKESVVDPIVDMKNRAVALVMDLWKGLMERFDSIRSGAVEKFNAVKDAIIKPIEKAKEKVDQIIKDIKAFFDNLKLKIPEPSMPKLPHFSLRTSTKTVLGKEIKFPSGIDVEWYAKGGILTKPTAFGMNGNSMMVGGEAGKEAVIPLTDNNLAGIGKGIESQMFNGSLENMLNTFINNMSMKQRPIELAMVTTLDGKIIGESAATFVDDTFVQTGNDTGSGLGGRRR